MATEFNIYFEIFGTLMFFAMFWLIFYQLNYQESKNRRILLIVSMALYQPLLAVIEYQRLFQLPDLLRILLPVMMIAALAFLAGGKKISVWITAAYFSGAVVFIDAISTAMVLGFSGNLTSEESLVFSKELYFYGGISTYIVLFIAAVVFYLVMRAVPREALGRISLRVWLMLLLIQPAGTATFYIPLDSLLTQLSAGYNNFLFLGFSLLLLFALNLVILYLFTNHVSGYSARLLAGELNETPPVYSPQDGLSSGFIEKYGLTSREAEIAAALLRGKSDKEIAVLLHIAVNTVQVHLKSIYRKTGAPGRYALMSLVGLAR